MNLSQRNLAYQAAALLLVFGAVAMVVATASANLADRGIELGTEFLGDRAGFTLSESWLPYSPEDSNLWAIAAGVVNTLVIALFVGLFSTFIGTGLGILRLSENILAKSFARSWVEISRNSPPILLLLFLYSFLGQVLPVSDAIEPVPGVYLSLRGLALPSIDLQGAGWGVAMGALVTLAGLYAASRAATVQQKKSGVRPAWVMWVATGTGLVWVAIVLLWLAPLASVDTPRAEGPDIVGGFILSPEFFTLIAGLTFYTSGFVAEIVRTGLQSVTKGQWEASYALGLSRARTLRLVIIPQMLRVIIPPMTSQYINIVKNSTLVIAIGYADFMVVAGTVINKTSHAIEGTVIIIAIYLAINLSLSALMNQVNRRVQQGAI